MGRRKWLISICSIEESSFKKFWSEISDAMSGEARSGDGWSGYSGRKELERLEIFCFARFAVSF